MKKDSYNFGGTGWAGAKKQSAPQVGPLSDRPWSEYENKREAFVSAYMDDAKPVLSTMYSKRVRGYEAVGYAIRAPL